LGKFKNTLFKAEVLQRYNRTSQMDTVELLVFHILISGDSVLGISARGDLDDILNILRSVIPKTTQPEPMKIRESYIL
jgi:hypothetical protein